MVANYAINLTAACMETLSLSQDICLPNRIFDVMSKLKYVPFIKIYKKTLMV